MSPVTLPPATDPGLAVDGVSIDASAWLITVQFLSDRPWIDGDRFGIGLADTSGALVATCLVSCAMGNCRLEAFNGATLSGFVNIAVAQQFTLQFLTNNNPFLVCQSGSGTGIDKPAGALTPRLLATPEIQVTHIDVVVQD